MDVDEVNRLAGRYNTFPDTIQKDYAATILLLEIAQFSKISSMTFKGGTALKKIYYPETRFSEDLDFTCSEDISEELAILLEDRIKELDVNFTEVKKLDTSKNSRKYSVKYLNYNNHPASVKLDLSLRDNVITKVENQKINHIYKLEKNDISIPSMNLPEMMAEKVRAIIYAQKPRHLYDMWYLFGKGVKLDPNLVNSKIAFYNEEFSMERLKSGISSMKAEWDIDLNPLLPTVPAFDDVSTVVIESITQAMK